MPRKIIIAVFQFVTLCGVCSFEINQAILSWAHSIDLSFWFHVFRTIITPRFLSFASNYYTSFFMLREFTQLAPMLGMDLVMLYLFLEHEIPPALLEKIIGDDLLYKPKEPAHLPLEERQRLDFEEARRSYTVIMLGFACWCLYMSFYC